MGVWAGGCGVSQKGPCLAGSATVGTEALVEMFCRVGRVLRVSSLRGRGVHTHCCPLRQLLESPTMSILTRFMGLYPRRNRVMGTVNGETPGSVWHRGQGFSPSSTQLTHLPNGVGKMEWGALKGRAPWAGSCLIKMPSHSHPLKLDLSLGNGRTRAAMGMEGGWAALF